MNKTVVCLILLSASWSYGQVYHGRILDAETSQPIPYANIGIVSKDRGTVSMEDGSFQLTIDLAWDDDSLRISSIGYETQTFLVRSFKSKFSGNEPVNFSLLPKPVMLSELVISSRSATPIQMGNAPQTKYTKAGFFYNRLGHEIGTTFFLDKGVARVIDSVQLNIASCTYDSVFLRLNVYQRIAQGYENILPRNVFIRLTKKQALAKPVIDLQEFKLIVSDQFLVTVEIVKEMGESGFKFFARLNADKFPTIYRGTSHDAWKEVRHKGKPVGISLFVFGH
jgi:hypothetical protein